MRSRKSRRPRKSFRRSWHRVGIRYPRRQATNRPLSRRRSSMANINELMNGWGFGKQTAIGTANTVATIWRHTNLNTKPWAKVPVNEDDRAAIGKGHEFPTQLFKSHYNMPAYELSKYASSEFLAWAMSFSMGNVVVSGSGPYTYTIVPALGATNPTGLELPYFSFVQQIRPGGSADRKSTRLN